MGVEKEPKPKKAFEIKVVVWDDGEVDTELYEYRPNPSGRGAPGKWRANSTNFVRIIEETLGDPEQLLLKVFDEIGGNIAASAENKAEVSSQIAASRLSEGETPPESSDDEPEKEEQPKESKKRRKAQASSDDQDGEDISFGEFDKGKE